MEHFLHSVDDVAMEFLSKGCNHQLPETGISSQLVSARFISGSITAEGVGHFLTIPNSLLQHVKHLDLSWNKLDRRGCELLAEGVQRMPCLEKLDLSLNPGIGCGGAVQLVSSLHSSKLRKLDMTGTGISDPDFQCLSSYIHSTTSLEELWIGENEISVESIDSLCKALSANSSMRRLYMSDCHLTTSHCVCLGQLLRHPIHCQIEKLDLRAVV
ncbi:Leucine-rich repeat-containing protein 74B [Geodia barretti]|uniref:Leucine-rich repeat-containing protein 74B n=1 Tax=Geodia barretti TaxID=519541 RepID=A0AA35TZ55_GEOBA|nr:Leucine-rich repeat-containing protein 74B [Geodia barretti]